MGLCRFDGPNWFFRFGGSSLQSKGQKSKVRPRPISTNRTINIMSFINIDILKNPLNWVTVLMMLIIFAIFSDVVMSHYAAIRGTAMANPSGSNAAK